ncbi:hypothetical protein [Povalibacter sp.]|uniref:hypothetical protein n=1 Tax=Povalibacter sp. TaxID=1962978 RepID=UPI002F3EF5A8
MTKIDPALQAQVDAQLLEQGGFAPLELLINSGRLTYGDYEAWRRGDIESLDDVLMGSPEKIRAQVETASSYARRIGLVEQPQEFHSWQTPSPGAAAKLLRVSADSRLHRLIAIRHVPAQSVPQMDLFFDNPVVALTNGIARALSARDAAEAQRQLDRLYAQAPNHADLAAFDQLLTALLSLDQPASDAAATLSFLQKIAPNAKRLLGAQSRDLLSPLWNHFAQMLRDQPFLPEHPLLHRSYALGQAHDWAGVSESVRNEPHWWEHAELCLRLAHSAFYRQQRLEALTAWCHLCWLHPTQADQALGARTQPDGGMVGLWQHFLDSEDDIELSATDFPAWLLLHEPGLARHLAEDLPNGRSAGEMQYRCIHRLLQARRDRRKEDELALRRTLQADFPAMFSQLKRTV